MVKISKQYCITAIVAIFAVALLIAANYNFFRSAPRTPVSLTAVPLTSINKPIQIIRTGSIQKSTVVPVNAEYSGSITEIYVAEGQTVKAGQPLFKIETTSVQAANQTAEPSSEGQGSYDKALDEFNRCKRLFEIGAIPRRQMDAAAARLQEAKEGSASRESNVPVSSAIVNGSATVTAPTDGIITGLAAYLGKATQAGQQLVAIGSGQEVEVVIHLTQNDLYLAHLGTPAVIETEQQPISGQISSIYPQVEADQAASFLAHVKLVSNPAGLLKSGMAVNVRIDTGNSATVPAVPSASIFQDNKDRNFIYIAANGKAKLQQILIGETIGDLTEVTSDLQQQSLIITSNITEIKDGDPITVMQ